MCPIAATDSFVILCKLEGLIGCSVDVAAQFIRFRTLDQQRPGQEKGAVQCATQAQKIRLEVQIPAGTAEKDRIVAALVALRRMKIPAESLLPL